LDFEDDGVEDKGEKEGSQRVTLMDACAAEDAVVAKKLVGSIPVTKLYPCRQLGAWRRTSLKNFF
jgi:hypothetical protein